MVPLALPCQQATHSLLEAGLLLWNKWNPAETMRGIKRFCALLFQRGENWSSVCRAEEWAPCCIHKAEDTAEALSRNMSLMECVAIRKESLVTHPVLSAMSAVTGGWPLRAVTAGKCVPLVYNSLDCSHGLACGKCFCFSPPAQLMLRISSGENQGPLGWSPH